LINEVVVGYTPTHHGVGRRLGVINNMEKKIQMPMSDFRSIFDNIDKVIPLTEEDGFVISSQPCSSI
jgi:hypothetical protein